MIVSRVGPSGIWDGYAKQEDGMKITYYGQSAFKISDGDGTDILIDPWIDENPHNDRSAESFDDVTAVLVTHGGFDHLGNAPEISRRHDAELICDPATFMVLQDRGHPADLLQTTVSGAVHRRDGWRVKSLEARHVSAFADELVAGPALGYILELDGTSVYHLGDTSIFRDLELFGDLYEPTVSLVPVGEAEGYFSELHPDEAALVAEWLGSETFVPMHYPPGSAKPERFRDLCVERGVSESAVRLLDAEETLTV